MTTFHRTALVAGLLAVLSLFTPASAQQLALYEFDNGSLDSTATDPWSSAGSMTVANTHMFWDWGSDGWFLCLDPAWATTTPQNAANGSPNYLELTITPQAGQHLWVSGISMVTGVGSDPAVDTVAVYADEDPGPGGDNFQTALATDVDVYPQHPGSGGLATTHIDLSNVALVQNLDQPLTLRIYFWSGPHAGTGSAEIGSVTVEGCAGVTAIAQNLGPSCNHPLDPVLTAAPPVVGGTCPLSMTSQLPNAITFMFMSFAPTTPTYFPSNGCTIWVDILNPNNLWHLFTFYTDGNGDWQLTVPITEPAVIGAQVILQARVCLMGGPVGPLNPDFVSNGLYLRIGCVPD